MHICIQIITFITSNPLMTLIIIDISTISLSKHGLSYHINITSKLEVFIISNWLSKTLWKNYHIISIIIFDIIILIISYRLENCLIAQLWCGNNVTTRQFCHDMSQPTATGSPTEVRSDPKPTARGALGGGMWQQRDNKAILSWQVGANGDRVANRSSKCPQAHS